MLPVWDQWGERHACTVLQLDACVVVQAKSRNSDGYSALQLGVGEAKPSRVKATLRGHFAKCHGSDIVTATDAAAQAELTAPLPLPVSRHLAEFRVTEDALLPAGTPIQALHFVPGQVRGKPARQAGRHCLQCY